MVTVSIKEAAARAAHEANRAYCLAIGDASQPSWEGAPEWQRASALNGVESVVNGMGLEELHDSWMAEKKSQGWVWGPAKDPENKQHPCMIPYADLPQMQRAKDRIFGSVVRAVISAFEE
jgi:hypothetical protein